jgi:hypothetical protein
MHALLKRLGLGRLVYHLYHVPVASVRAVFRSGGPVQALRTARGRAAMEVAARRLRAPSPAGDGPPLSVHLLTGSRFWYQTAFCLHTLSTHSGRRVCPVAYDDGSLLPAQAEQLLRIFPGGRIVAGSETRERLERFLPRGRYPTLRERWDRYPNIRKLIDPHLGSRGWKLVIDSDLLFFREPAFLLSWSDAPGAPLHAVDVADAYGYTPGIMEALAGKPIPGRVNVGLCGLDSAAMDWPQIEAWCRALVEREGTSYYLEQALVAMLVAGRACAVAPAGDYVTLPRLPEALECRAVMHHYVAESKRWYFQSNWRRALQGTG